jgi:hypothetical protein
MRAVHGTRAAGCMPLLITSQDKMFKLSIMLCCNLHLTCLKKGSHRSETGLLEGRENPWRILIWRTIH